VAYYSQNEMTEQISFIVISYCLKHDTVATHLFQWKLCSFLSGKLKGLTKICHFFVVLPRSIKTGNISLCCHKDDFGVDDECHFLPTSHGKVHIMGLGE
jgi:hypothetical protein